MKLGVAAARGSIFLGDGLVALFPAEALLEDNSKVSGIHESRVADVWWSSVDGSGVSPSPGLWWRGRYRHDMMMVIAREGGSVEDWS